MIQDKKQAETPNVRTFMNSKLDRFLNQSANDKSNVFSQSSMMNQGVSLYSDPNSCNELPEAVLKLLRAPSNYTKQDGDLSQQSL